MEILTKGRKTKHFRMCFISKVVGKIFWLKGRKRSKTKKESKNDGRKWKEGKEGRRKERKRRKARKRGYVLLLHAGNSMSIVFYSKLLIANAMNLRKEWAKEGRKEGRHQVRRIQKSFLSFSVQLPCSQTVSTPNSHNHHTARLRYFSKLHEMPCE